MGGGSFCGRNFSYVIGTGQLWDGPILNGRVVFDHSELVSTNFVYKSDTNNELKPEYFDDSTVYSFTNYIPKTF
jgi:hypothetical protein